MDEIIDTERFDYTTELSHELCENGYYIVEVTLYESGRIYIEIFDVEPDGNIWDQLMDYRYVPIKKGHVGKYGNWRNKIKSLLFEYEYPYYQKQQLLEQDNHIVIDYEAEAKKRRPKPKKQEQEQDVQIQPLNGKIKYTHWQSDEPEYIETSGKPMHRNSYTNLKQFQHLK